MLNFLLSFFNTALLIFVWKSCRKRCAIFCLQNVSDYLHWILINRWHHYLQTREGKHYFIVSLTFLIYRLEKTRILTYKQLYDRTKYQSLIRGYEIVGELVATWFLQDLPRYDSYRLITYMIEFWKGVKEGTFSRLVFWEFKKRVFI